MDRRDRSEREPALGDLFSARPLSRLPAEEIDALRRLVRFVWTSATLVGVWGRARRAAAAAAEERLCDEVWRVKAEAAAVAAFGFAVAAVRGCREMALARELRLGAM